MICQAVGCR